MYCAEVGNDFKWIDYLSKSSSSLTTGIVELEDLLHPTRKKELRALLRMSYEK